MTKRTSYDVTLGAGRHPCWRYPDDYSRRQGERSVHWVMAWVAQAVVLSVWHCVQGLGILYLIVANFCEVANLSGQNVS